MWAEAFILLGVYSLISGDPGEIFDITTVYNVGNLCKDYREGVDEVDSNLPSGKSCTSGTINGRVHIGKNALGLRLHGGPWGEDIYPKSSWLFDNSTCMSNRVCSWNKKSDWISTLLVDSTPDWRRTFQCQSKKDKYIDWSYVCDGRSMYIYGEQYGCPDQSDESFCKSYNCDSTTIHCKSGRRACIARTWKCDSHIDCQDGSDEAGCSYNVTSPFFTPSSQQSCMTLIFKAPNDKLEDLLHVLVEDKYHTEHFITAVRNVKSGLNVRRLNITFHTNILAPVKLIIRTANNNTDEVEEVQILQITGCDSTGKDVEQLPLIDLTAKPSSKKRLPSLEVQTIEPDLDSRPIEENLPVPYVPDLDNLKETLPVYDAYFQDNANFSEPSFVSDQSNQCLNGGKLTTAGCACSPGFFGTRCEQGCGKNRFGQDCRDFCSLHLKECEGLFLCAPLFNCTCAPGYKGKYCDKKCDDGWYGNDCSLVCGNCASSEPCNIYSGECTSCEPGYVPPLCQIKYVFYELVPETSSPDYGKITVTFYPENVTGHGTPTLYQIQYRENQGLLLNDWNIVTTKAITTNGPSSVEEEIDGLKDGISYDVRVLFMDNSFNKYDGDDVPVATVVTKCDVPRSNDYNVAVSSDMTSHTFLWSIKTISKHQCPLDNRFNETYEVSWNEDWQWFTKLVPYENITLGDYVPGSTIKFKVRAKLHKGYAPYSDTSTVTTKYNASSSVKDIKVVSFQSNSVDISWKPPIGNEGRKLRYRVTYKCLNQPSCPPGCHNMSTSTIIVDQTNATLSSLLPFTQYLVSVTPEGGETSSIFTGTPLVLPMEIPKLSDRKPIRTNTSLTVFWDAVPVCSSFLEGYKYHLIKKPNGLGVDSGFTRFTNVTFHNLSVHTEYEVRVIIKTMAGYSQFFLSIPTSTTSSVPEAVQNLTVYKRGRNMIGLRWAPPLTSYGSVKSFTVSHSLGQETTSHTVEPSPCTPWPKLYCHTISDLRANRKYNITVSARNEEVQDDGHPAFITAITNESAPSAPEDLGVVNRSSTSVGLQWRHPNFTNGVLRSFVVSVEETEMHDQDSCCQVYPLVEIPVGKELQTYEAEVSGLHYASTYFVSVTAKTVGLGPSQSLVVQTRPPHLPFTTLPLQGVLERDMPLLVDEQLTWMPQEDLPETNNSDVYTPLIKTYLLFAVFNETNPSEFIQENASELEDSRLNQLLQHLINKPFYYLGEYTQEALISDSRWGVGSTLPSGHTYQLVAAQITEYSGFFNADLRYSKLFILK